MVRLAATFAAVGGLAITLSGCGDSAAPSPSPSPAPSPGPSPPSGGNSTTAAPAPSPGSTPALGTSTTASGTAPPFSTQSPDGKTPLYVVLRMDDISPVDHSDVQTDIMSWMVDNKVKFNFGVIVGGDPTDVWSPYWPTTCQEDPTAMYCDDPVVQRVKQAYDTGDILGTGPDAVLELGNHAYNHAGWGLQWAGFVPKPGWNEWQDLDLMNSTAILNQLYPNALIKSFHAPENAASAANLESMKKYGLEILTSAGTLSGCEGNSYWLTAPCDVQVNDSESSIEPQCMPAGDVWATVDGFSQVNGIVSAPAGSANSLWSGGAQAGISVDETIGVGDCGCHAEGSRVSCSIIGSAKNNAFKSNGLHWSVLMMHPQTQFGEPAGAQSYVQWLDEFHQKMSALTEYTVHYINFQDLARLPAPGPAGALFM